MTIEIIDYPNEQEMKLGKKQKASQGLRSNHTDFINNDKSQGYRITFVDGVDDVNNNPDNVSKTNEMIQKQRRKRELQNKPVLNNVELKEAVALMLEGY